MELKDLPTFLLKPLPRSRVKGHVQSLALFNLRTDTGFEVELAICENVFAIRRKSATSNIWEKWVDTAFDDHAAALEKLKTETTSWTKRKYFSLVSTGLLLPLNETDVRHLRNDGLLPRAILEYGSELYGAIAAWYAKELERHNEIATAATAMSATPPAPAAAPSVTAPPPAASTGPASTASLDDVLGKLKTRTAAVK